MDDAIIIGLYRNISVTKNTITSSPSVEYVPIGYTSRLSSSDVMFLHLPDRNSETNGSLGRNSRKKPKVHKIKEILSHCSMIAGYSHTKVSLEMKAFMYKLYFLIKLIILSVIARNSR